jgi:hypothetical protein
MGGRGDSAKSFNTIGKDGFARTATVIPATAMALTANVYKGGPPAQPLKLVGHQKDDFFIHERGGQQVVTHLPTGAVVHRLDTLQQAKSVVDSISPLSSQLTRFGEASFLKGKKKGTMSERERSDLREKMNSAAVDARSKFPSTAKRNAFGSRRGETLAAREAQAKKKEDRFVI